MAGVKRKLAASQGQPAERDTQTTENTSDPRASRSSRDTRNSRGNRNENPNPAPHGGRSRIVTLSTRGARGRETRNSRGRVAEAPTVSQASPPAATQDPETPRSKRARKTWDAEETPRTTRQSARLKAHANPYSHDNGDVNGKTKEEDPLQESPSVVAASNNRAPNKKIHTFDGTNDASYNQDSVEAASKPRDVTAAESAAQSTSSQPGETQNSSAEQNSSEEKTHNSNGVKNETGEASSTIGPIEESPNNLTLSGSSRKRKSLGIEDDNNAESTPSSKKRRIENDELDRSLEEQLQNGPNQEAEAHSPVDTTTTEHNAEDNSHQEAEETGEFIPVNGAETASASGARGGRGGRARGGRGRARGRGGRSRGGARGRGGRTRGGRATGRGKNQADHSSDIEFDRRSPPPSETTQKLRERQRELDKAFKRVALAQRLALSVLAAQSQERLARDKHAHEIVPEYEEVMQALAERLEKQKEIFRYQYELDVEQENRLYAANRERIERRFRASALHIQEEHLTAAQGAYMAFVEGVRVAEDDEHTETDGSETEYDGQPLFAGQREFVRGFNSSFVRDLTGAAEYERASSGWDDFVQRAKMGGEVKEIREEGSPFAGRSAPEIIAMLIAATGTVELAETGPDDEDARERQPSVDEAAAAARPDALLTLADIAAAQLPQVDGPATASHPTYQAIYTQPAGQSQGIAAPAPGPTGGPRSFMPPHPSPPTTSKQQPRRLLPAGRQQIPPINQQLGLPDPFGTLGGRPQLPPPSGSNFHQPPPAPGHLMTPSHPQQAQQLYYPPQGSPPPPPPPPPAGGPRHTY